MKIIEADYNSLDLSELVRSMQPHFPDRDMSGEDVCGNITVVLASSFTLAFGFFKDDGNFFFYLNDDDHGLIFVSKENIIGAKGNELNMANFMISGMHHFVNNLKNKKQKCMSIDLYEDGIYSYRFYMSCEPDNPEKTGIMLAKIHKRSKQHEWVMAILGEAFYPLAKKLGYLITSYSDWCKNNGK